ncbi:hypothetical protein D918_03928 [Trichuris suis]|nr:hypothetical protein D918_03928 [Trichuris suis]
MALPIAVVLFHVPGAYPDESLDTATCRLEVESILHVGSLSMIMYECLKETKHEHSKRRERYSVVSRGRCAV